MPAYHDFICDACGWIELDMPVTVDGTECLECHQGRLEIWWMNARPRNAVALSKDDSVVVWQNPESGKIIYPGRNDAPMPERYASTGFEKLELRSLKSIDDFSKKHGLVNEAAHYNKGNAYDSERGRR